MKYKGDKYIKAYKHFRNEQDKKIIELGIRLADLERMVEWLLTYIIEGKK